MLNDITTSISETASCNQAAKWIISTTSLNYTIQTWIQSFVPSISLCHRLTMATNNIRLPATFNISRKSAFVFYQILILVCIICSNTHSVMASMQTQTTTTTATSAVPTSSDANEYTNEFAVHIKHCDESDYYDDETSEKSAQELAKRYGFAYHGKIGNLACHYLFSHEHVHKRSTEYAHKHHTMLASDPTVHWVEQQRILTRKKRDNSKTKYRYRDSMPDPIFKDMWYLKKGAIGNFDMNVENAWRMGYTGKNVVVTILDDGIQPNHPELARNYDSKASFDINDNDPDPTPQDNGDNKHGTRCAGEVAAEAYNEFCGVGIAFNASIGGVRMLDGIVTDQVEARAISHNPNHIDIYSASWGPEDDGKTVDGPGKLAKRAFMDGIKKGRRGKGSIYVWASGNGGRRLDNCNCDGYTNSIYTLSISSATQNGAKPWYLEECSSTLSTTYSSGTPGKDENILTCDQDTSYFSELRKGEKPQRDSLCTKSHTGTSASAPIAAAILALALEANPTLTWRDLQYLVILSSRYEPLRHEKGWTNNAVDRKVSHKFGYGLLDAEAIVRYAEKWTTVPPQRICETPSQNKERDISQKVRTQLEVSLLTNACRGTQNEVRFIEHVQARITLRYKPRGSLKISLISPLGTISHLLFPRPRDTEELSFNAWPFLSVHFWGEKPSGTWRLVIQNEGSKNAPLPGKLYSWSLIFYGTYEKPASQVYNETLRYYPRSTSPATTATNECMQNDMYKQYESDECVKRCGPREWANTDAGQCQPCNNVCDSCFGPSSDHCLSCASGLFFEYHCLANCPIGYFNPKDLDECLPCSTNCLTCVGLADNCTQCRDNLVLGSSGQCLPSPPTPVTSDNSSVVLAATPACHDPISCTMCKGPLRSDCLQCNAPYKLFNGFCIDESCPDGYYFKQGPLSQLAECLRCHYSCKTCTGPSHFECVTCHKNSTLTNTPTGTCQPCVEGHFLNQATTKCESCHSSCSTCSGPLASDCLTCKPSLHLDNLHCVPCCQQTSNTNEISSNILPAEFTECCQCVDSKLGPCLSSRAIDRIRSIEALAEQMSDDDANNGRESRPLSWWMLRIVSHTVGYVLVIAILFSVSMIWLKRRSKSKNHTGNATSVYQYKKLNHSSHGRFRFAPDRLRLVEEEDDDDEDEELSLFEKT